MDPSAHPLASPPEPQEPTPPGPASSGSPSEESPTTVIPPSNPAAPGSALAAAGAWQLPIVDRHRYLLDGVVAEGGHGRILRAQDLHLQRAVALKELLLPGGPAEPRFLNEARITARLQHPAIVPVYEAGRWPGGEPFYAMKLVRGRSFDRLISSATTLPQRLALLPHVLAVADAMAYAHEQHVIHRDLKPANILVGSFGETVVIDWGLAKELGHDEPAPAEPLPAHATPPPGSYSPERTQLGTVMGTPAYMPPEQAAGQPVDERADVYALGAILYHLLAGRPPYTGTASQEVIEQVLKGEPTALGTLQPGTPRELQDVVSRAMAREPAQRYPSARELAEDLRRFQTGQLVGAHRYSTWELLQRSVRRHRAALAVACVAAAIVLVMGTLSVRKVIQEKNQAHQAWQQADQAEREATRRADERTLEQARSSLAQSPERTLQLLSDLSPSFNRWGAVRTVAADALAQGLAARILRGHSLVVNHVTFFKDGRRLLTTSDDRTVRLWDLHSGQSTVLETLADEAWGAMLSPDERYLSSTSKDGTLRLRDLEQDTARTLRGHTAGVLLARFSPDGRWLYSGGKDGRVMAWEVRTGEGRLLLSYEGAVQSMALLSAGRYLVSTGGMLSQLRLWDLQKGAEVPLRQPPGTHLREGKACTYALLPGDMLALSHVSGGLLLWNRTTGQSRLLERPAALSQGLIQATTTSKDGRYLAAQLESGATLLWDLQGPATPRVLEGGAMGWGLALAFSPDGRWLAAGGRDGKARLWEVSTGRVHLLHGAQDTVSYVAFSPDGQWLATASHDSAARLYPLERPHEHVLRPGGGQLLATFSADGRSVLSVAEGGQVRLSALEGTESPSEQAHPEGLTAAALLEDGSRLATAGRSGAVLLWDGAGQRLQQLSGPPGEPWRLAIAQGGAWVAAGYQSGEVWLWEASSGQGRRLGQHEKGVSALAFSPDGRHLASGGQEGETWLWEVASGEGRRVYRHLQEVRSLAFSPGGQRLASGSEDHTVWLLELGSGQGRRLDVGGAGVRQVLFSRDGGTLWSASSGDNAVRQWRVGTGEQGPLLRTPALEVTALALSPEGRRLLVGGKDGAVRLWDVESGESRSLPGHTREITSLAFSPDGREVLAAAADGTVRVWPDDLPLEPKAVREQVQAEAHRLAAP